jgi:hypothetical protein
MRRAYRFRFYSFFIHPDTQCELLDHDVEENDSRREQECEGDPMNQITNT